MAGVARHAAQHAWPHELFECDAGLVAMVVWSEFNSVASCSSVAVAVCGTGMYVCLETPSRGALHG
jgi:hypothetical protein